MKNYPKSDIVFTGTNPVEQEMIIAFFKQSGIPVYEGTDKYDPTYPYVKWDGKHLTQCRQILPSHNQPVDSAVEFVGLFTKQIKTITLNSSYEATINYHDQIVKVGCQTFPFSKIRELAAALDS
jgi:hypothetical protein